MRLAIKKEFGTHTPQAIVLDDNARARTMTARQLRERGFEVTECANSSEFREVWSPGSTDVIVSDWQLSHSDEDGGDKILAWVRERDWDVPFVLVSGKLDEAVERVGVLANLLQSGNARFVRRGHAAIKNACDLAEDLVERRDLALLKTILIFREAAKQELSIATSSGRASAKSMLESIVAKPSRSHDATRPVATAQSKRLQRVE